MSCRFTDPLAEVEYMIGLLGVVQEIKEKHPQELRWRSWLFIRRHDGRYLVSFLDWSCQAASTNDGLAADLCEPDNIWGGIREVLSKLASGLEDTSFEGGRS